MPAATPVSIGGAETHCPKPLGFCFIELATYSLHRYSCGQSPPYLGFFPLSITHKKSAFGDLAPPSKARGIVVALFQY